MKISIHVGPRSMTIGTAAALLNANCRENGLSWSQWRMLLIAAPGNDYHRLRFFRVKTAPKAARKARFVRVRIRAVKVVLNEFVAGSYTSLANVSRTIPLLPMLLPRSSHRASSIKVSCLVALQLQRPRLGSRAIPACLPSNLTLFGVDIYFIFGIPGTLWCEYYVLVFIIHRERSW